MKKFNLLFILILSAFLAFSCSHNDDEEELTDTGSENEDSDDIVTSDIDKLYE